MKKTVSLDHAMLKAARHQKAFGDGRSLRDSKFAAFMQDGNMITGKMACVWHTGDGVKYGWKSSEAHEIVASPENPIWYLWFPSPPHLW